MIKKIVLIFTLLFILNIESSAANKKLALEIARAKDIEKIILRVNSIYDYINLYIMETAKNPLNMNEITSKYSGLKTNGYNGTSITFSLNNKIIKFSNIISTNASNNIKQIYKNSVNLHPFANILVNLDMEIPIDTNSRKLLAYKDMLLSFNTSGTIFVEDTKPDCTSTIHKGRVWYQPDFNGKFIVKACVSPSGANNWVSISNDLNIGIFRTTHSDLGNIKPPLGTIAYAETTAGSNIFAQYVYSGDDGNGATNDWKRLQ
jgi:hypothetical protein